MPDILTHGTYPPQQHGVSRRVQYELTADDMKVLVTGGDNIRHLLDYSSFELLRHDVCEPLLLQVDQVFNLACPASPTQRRPDITRAQTRLGWSPTIALREGLERTVPYFADRLQRLSARHCATLPAGHFPFSERRRGYAEVASWAERPVP